MQYIECNIFFLKNAAFLWHFRSKCQKKCNFNLINYLEWWAPIFSKPDRLIPERNYPNARFSVLSDVPLVFLHIIQMSEQLLHLIRCMPQLWDRHYGNHKLSAVLKKKLEKLEIKKIFGSKSAIWLVTFEIFSKFLNLWWLKSMFL